MSLQDITIEESKRAPLIRLLYSLNPGQWNDLCVLLEADPVANQQDKFIYLLAISSQTKNFRCYKSMIDSMTKAIRKLLWKKK